MWRCGGETEEICEWTVDGWGWGIERKSTERDDWKGETLGSGKNPAQGSLPGNYKEGFHLDL